ncbi:MAG: polysaccharide deacetylase family protein [Clostridia bacterium]|nr:polysaccharide deacetylase family protein [Clostridia bacterium]
MRYRFLRFPEGKVKAITFSYDDGVRDDLVLADIINKYGIKCTFNHTNTEHMTKDEVIENIISKGHEIAVHGAEHRAEGLQRPVEAIEDVLSCRKKLESEFDMIIRGMAYPDSGIRNLLPGVTYENIKSYLKNLDIVYARTLGGDNNLFRLPEDWYAWTPTAHHANPELGNYIDDFLNIDVSKLYIAGRFPRLFYLWGHSYEFERNNNWELLEDICSKLSGKDDIWYATNMEIYEYVNAYNSLIYSADGLRIYNPTLYTVWFETDGTLYSVKSGETICLKNN